ncbi:MAG: hypothetical protein QM730_12285 [Anaerolineales bacterium]
MFAKNQKSFPVRFILLLVLTIGMFGVVPVKAGAAPAETVVVSGTIPQVQIIVPAYPIGMDAGKTELIPFKLQEMAGASGKFTSKTLQFFTQYDVPLSGLMGPYSTNIQINALSTTKWNESVYLPASVVSNARSMKKYAIVLKTTFSGTSATGAKFTARSSLLLLLPPAPFSKSSPADGAIVSLDKLSLKWNSSVGAIDYEYCFDTINNNSCDTEWIGSYWLSTYDTFATIKSLPSKTFYWQVRATNLSGKTYANNDKWWSFRVIFPAPILVSPNEGDYVLNLRPTFTWENVPEKGVTDYTIQISTSSTFATIAHTGKSTASTYTPAVDLPRGKLYWRVRTNGTNGPSAWSEVRSYQGPNPPIAPVVGIPANNALLTDTTPLFKWSISSVPIGSAQFDHYQLQVANDSGFTFLVLNEDINGLSTNTFTPATELATNSKFYWRILAFNNLGQNSTSVTWSFRTALLPVSLNALPNSNHPITLRPTFSWSDPNNMAPLATGYSIQLSTVSNFSSLLINGTTATGVTSFTPRINLPAGKTLYWRVLANGANGPSPWSKGSFSTATPPSVPTLSLPANASLNTNYIPTLKWSVVTSVIAFDHYQVQVDDDPLFGSPELEDNSHILATQNKLTTPALPHNTKYYWRVLAFNKSGQYSSSAIWSFRTALTPPILVSPAIFYDVPTLRPTFEWEDVRETGVSGYTIQISLSSSFTTIIHTGNSVAATYTPMVDLPRDRVLYWRVQTRGTNGPSAWSELSPFTSANAPTTPILSLPALNSLNSNYTPLLRWSAVIIPVETTLQYYQVQVDDDKDFSSPLIDDASITDRSITQYQVDFPLEHNTKFYWRVRAVNTAEEVGNWSAVWYFRTRVDAPILISPMDNSFGSTRTPFLTWENVLGNSGYVLQVWKAGTTPTLIKSVTLSMDVSQYQFFTGLLPNTAYFWRVQTRGVNGPSLWSPSFYFTTIP